MSNPKVIVLAVQPTYALCMVDGKQHVERLTAPTTKEEVKVRVLAQLKAKAAIATDPSADLADASRETSETPAETDVKQGRKPKG